jgi:alanyl-tRNA synthetase
MQGGRIFYYDAGKNWWSRSGKPSNMPVGEIGGPDSEVFYDFGPEHATHPIFSKQEPHPNSDSGQFLEIGNSVFIEYIKQEDGSFAKLPQRNVDFGGGLERIAAAKVGHPDVFHVDLLHTVVIKQIAELSGQLYAGNEVAFRVITDHIRGAVFMIGDGCLSEQRPARILRTSTSSSSGPLCGQDSASPAGKFAELASSVITTYESSLSESSGPNVPTLRTAIAREEEQFRKTLEAGMKQFNKISLQIHVSSTEVDGKKVIDKDVFHQ